MLAYLDNNENSVARKRLKFERTLDRVVRRLQVRDEGRGHDPRQGGPERELRPRAAGAAHARRRRRLHPERRAGSRPLLHRLELQPVRRASSTSRRTGTTKARRSCSASDRRQAAASATASRCSTCSPEHPSTARFISRKLCQRFVADDPPAELVDRVGQGVHATPTATSGRWSRRS